MRVSTAAAKTPSDIYLRPGNLSNRNPTPRAKQHGRGAEAKPTDWGLANEGDLPQTSARKRWRGIARLGSGGEGR